MDVRVKRGHAESVHIGSHKAQLIRAQADLILSELTGDMDTHPTQHTTTMKSALQGVHTSADTLWLGGGSHTCVVPTAYEGTWKVE